MKDMACFVEDLILVRLLAASKKPPGAGQIEKDLYRFFDGQLSTGEFKSELDGAIERLVESGRLLKRPFRLTDSARQRALAFLQIDALPARTTWAQLRDQYVIAFAFGLSPSSKEAREGIKDLNRLRGMVLKHGHVLRTVEYPSCKQSVDALAWRNLGGLETTAPFTMKNVVRHLLGQDLNTPCRQSTEQLRNQLVAKTLRARSTEAAETRWAVLRRWAKEQTEATQSIVTNAAEDRFRAPPPTPSAEHESVPMGSPAAGTTPRTTATVSQPVATPSSTASATAERASQTASGTGARDLAEFAGRVLQAARASESGRFGEHKVFISHVWRRFRERELEAGPSLEEFKSQLVEANKQGRLSLSRADLVAAMDPTDVAESETRHLNATFHFVQI